MDAFNLTDLMEVLQLIAIVTGIIVLLKNVPSRREMEQAEIRENRRRFDTLMAKLDINFHALNEKLDAIINELRSEIRELNRDYKDHPAQHAIRANLMSKNRWCNPRKRLLLTVEQLQHNEQPLRYCRQIAVVAKSAYETIKLSLSLTICLPQGKSSATSFHSPERPSSLNLLPHPAHVPARFDESNRFPIRPRW